MGKGDLLCIGCHKHLGNGDTIYFWKNNQTTYMLCRKCNDAVEEFILNLREKNLSA